MIRKIEPILTTEVENAQGAIAKVTLYRAAFKPAEHTKFLDKAQLIKAKKVTLEIGSLELKDEDVPLFAVIEDGMIVDLKLKSAEGCKDCQESAAGKLPGKTQLEILHKLKGLNVPNLQLPVAVAFSRSLGWRIPIGPIVIGPEGPDCIYIENTKTGRFCIICPTLSSCW